jgi:hypothetical protein
MRGVLGADTRGMLGAVTIHRLWQHVILFAEIDGFEKTREETDGCQVHGRRDFRFDP